MPCGNGLAWLNSALVLRTMTAAPANKPFAGGRSTRGKEAVKGGARTTVSLAHRQLARCQMAARRRTKAARSKPNLMTFERSNRSGVKQEPWL